MTMSVNEESIHGFKFVALNRREKKKLFLLQNKIKEAFQVQEQNYEKLYLLKERTESDQKCIVI